MVYLMRSLLVGYMLAALTGYWLLQAGSGAILSLTAFWLGGAAISLFLVAASYVILVVPLQKIAPLQPAARPQKIATPRSAIRARER